MQKPPPDPTPKTGATVGQIAVTEHPGPVATYHAPYLIWVAPLGKPSTSDTG